ncbi:alcohol dehydrogenase catalytic domain-containing protein [Sphingopyxis granuli]|nr:alcohol dehydrogenase catalytic domain-containing protein [Sphingopyxis granuli]
MKPETMRAARMYDVGAPMVLEEVPTPKPTALDVIVKVHACGIVPNLGNVLRNWTTWFPKLPLPKLPATFGLDPAGTVVEVGSGVTGLKVGDRVYVNPGRSCGTCRACSAGNPIGCRSMVLQGYFGFTEKAQETFDRYPFGGLCEYMIAPANGCVKLPDNLTCQQATRLGYTGTGYSALRKGGAGPDVVTLVNGATGTLGLPTVLCALAMGTTKVLAVARNKALLEELRQIAPDRIFTHSTEDGPVRGWAIDQTDGDGVDLAVDCVGPGGTGEQMLDVMRSLRRTGRLVNVGAVAERVPVNVHKMMDWNQSLIGSVWFTTAEGMQLAEMIRAKTLDFNLFKQEGYPLERINEVLAGIENRHGGFSNFSVIPNPE